MFKVLIVDREEEDIKNLERLPVWNQDTGFDIDTRAYDGRTALELLHKKHFDMVIADINLPFIDGLQLLRHVNQEKLCPIFVILGDNTDFHYVRECLIFGAFDYLKKLPEAEMMKSLFERAHLYLSTRQENLNPAAGYPIEEEREILALFQKKNPFAVTLFKNSIEAIYHRNSTDILRADMLARKFYLNIITGIFSIYKWLEKYHCQESYVKPDYIQDDSPQRFSDFFFRKLSSLFDFIIRFEPATADATIHSICQHLLAHPEDDLRLKVIAHHFFLNHTYLCGHFSNKTNIYYSNYVSMIKMARAEYLLNHTELKIYEICEQLGFQDTNYFSRQFKKHHGKSPKVYREVSYQDYAFL